MGVWKNIVGIIGNVVQFNFTGPKLTGSSTDTLTVTSASDGDGKIAAVNANHESIEIYDGAARKTTVTMATGGAGDFTFVLPNDAGAAGNFLSTDGAGNLSWIDADAGCIKTYVLNYDGSATKELIAAASNRYIDKVQIKVTTAFDATGVLVDIGQTGSVDLYVDQTEVDLTTLGTYIIDVAHFESASKDALLTFTAGSGGTVGVAQVTLFCSIPGVIT